MNNTIKSLLSNMNITTPKESENTQNQLEKIDNKVEKKIIKKKKNNLNKVIIDTKSPIQKQTDDSIKSENSIK